MKTWPVILGIIIILAVFCSPGLAITKSDILSQYQTGTWPLTTIPTPSGTGTSTGTLSVISEPTGASVYLDDVYKGITPITITGMASGMHQLRVTLSGYEEHTATISIQSGRITSIPVTLKVQSVPGSSVERQVESAILKYTNQERTAAGLTPLIENPLLTSVARAHSLDMKERDFFSHTNPDWITAFERIAAAGYQYTAAGENIAAISSFTLDSNPDEVGRYFVQEMWMKSTGHRKNILTTSCTEIGIGVVYESDQSSSPYGFIATQNFGKPLVQPGPTTIPTTVPTITPTPTPLSGGTGSLSVTSNPTGATVYLDGIERGITPITITGLFPGYHKLMVATPGFRYKDYSTWFWIRTGKTATIHVTLKDQSIPTTAPTTIITTQPTPVPTTGPTPIPTQTPSSGGTGTLSVTSDPTGATVCLDGMERGITPVTITGLSTGLHKLTVSRSGYEDYSTGIIILTGKTVKAHATLEVRDEIEFYDDTSVRKPNIYLYSDRDLTARVRLEPERAITVSEPAYRPGMGWRAEVRNGSLNGMGDFLFYEALVPYSGWQNKEGYVIRAEYREQDMTFILGQYGFNEKETVDFVHYWVSHLPGDVDYVFYPQETGAVESVMPLIISPEPDDVMRIWFYAEPLVSAPEPVTSPEKIVREGFYVVEWGVMVRDE